MKRSREAEVMQAVVDEVLRLVHAHADVNRERLNKERLVKRRISYQGAASALHSVIGAVAAIDLQQLARKDKP